MIAVFPHENWRSDVDYVFINNGVSDGSDNGPMIQLPTEIFPAAIFKHESAKKVLRWYSNGQLTITSFVTTAPAKHISI